MLCSRRQFLAAAMLVGFGSAAAGKESLFLRPPKRPATGVITPQSFSAARAIAAINDIRAARGRPALSGNGTLTAMAAWQARELVALKTMTHSPRGMQLKERAASAGYKGQVAENLADGYETFELAITAWLASSSHRTTMLSERYTHLGAAVAVAPDAVPGDWGIYWVTEFGN